MTGPEGIEGVQKAVQVMNDYSLLREDLDNLMELTMWEGFSDKMKNIESKVKAAFTRTYNKEVFLPYATNIGTIAKKAKVALQESGFEEDEVDNSDDDKDENDIELDTMIKAKKTKASTAKTVAKEKKGKAATGKVASAKGASGKGKK